jgi:predicted DNA-binding WGR domain protein
MSDEGKTIFHERVEWLGRNNANASRKSDKFYEITITTNNGAYCREIRRWGRYGTKGQTKLISHFSERSAINSARKQLNKKRDKGYTNVIAPLKRLASAMDD